MGIRALAAGSFVTPSIRLVEPLGRGAMGCVWIADHLPLRSRVAVKFLSSELASQDDCVKRFEREAAAAAQVRSPHVVQVFDFGIGAEDTPYIVMELLEGQDLAAKIREDGPLPLHALVPIVEQACKALAWAHARRVVHRDVKPENIFLCAQPTKQGDGPPFVKLLDFGIAKGTTAGQGLTGCGVWVGSPSYMSPEQIDGRPDVDGRADLWSLAVVAYEALTGTRPFRGGAWHEMMLHIQTGAHEPPSHLRRELPASIDAWFARAFTVDRDQRFHDAAEMAYAFLRAARDAFELGETLQARTSPFPLMQRPSARAVPSTTVRPLVSVADHDDASERPSVRDVYELEPSVSRWPHVLVGVGIAAAAMVSWMVMQGPVQPPRMSVVSAAHAAVSTIEVPTKSDETPKPAPREPSPSVAVPAIGKPQKASLPPAKSAKAPNTDVGTAQSLPAAVDLPDVGGTDASAAPDAVGSEDAAPAVQSSASDAGGTSAPSD